jgi:hypothetical protein
LNPRFPKKQNKKQTVLAQIREQHKKAKALAEQPSPPYERFPDSETIDEVLAISRKIARARLMPIRRRPLAE